MKKKNLNHSTKNTERREEKKSVATPWSLRGALPLFDSIASGSPEAIHPLTGGAYAIRIASLRSQ
jgi:hypothetical protein